MLNDGVTWPEAVLTLGFLMFIGFCIIAIAVMVVSFTSRD